MQSRYPEYVKQLPEWHPVKVYFDENAHLRRIIEEIKQVDAGTDYSAWFNLFNQLCEVDKRYTRKENQLFPYLEKRGWNGPSQGMWAFHDANRDLLRAVRKKIDGRDFEGLNDHIQVISAEMERLILVEEMRLFPYSLELLTSEDWQEMREGEEEIGWMHKQLQKQEQSTTGSSSQVKGGLPFSVDGRIRMDEGYMTPEQINLMLKFMPIDLTYVDENDRVVFYNRGEDRVFPRSAGVIGREVRFCHPPKSVDTVLRIVDEFRHGTKDDAEFWIKYRGKVIHIRYFAIRDKDNNYKGVIELSQDITNIQKLEGEKRLLSWDE